MEGNPAALMPRAAAGAEQIKNPEEKAASLMTRATCLSFKRLYELFEGRIRTEPAACREETWERRFLERRRRRRTSRCVLQIHLINTTNKRELEE